MSEKWKDKFWEGEVWVTVITSVDPPEVMVNDEAPREGIEPGSGTFIYSGTINDGQLLLEAFKR